ncbi:PepSY domain-containing protein [Streptomyces sp. NPDC058595]|uniref:PepSY domain-containing protein n=1 Tax=Streptomyces sp. NPDC058595 TaxID=3346550 RepID=UPI00365DE2C6
MKRNLVIASITAAALIGGGTYTAVATGATDTGADTAPKTVSSASLVNDDDRDDRDDRNEPGDDRDDNGGSGDDAGGRSKDGTSAAGSKLTAAQAAAAALKQRPGKVESVDLDDDDDDDRSSAGRHWEVDIIGQDGKWYDLRVDASTGALRADNDDNDDDDDRHERAAVRGAEIDAQGAAAAALEKHPGAVTSVDSDDDDRKAGHWEVTVRGDDGRTHEVTVDMSSGAVAADRDDNDDRDDHGDDDRDDDRHDDRGDDDGDDD